MKKMIGVGLAGIGIGLVVVEIGERLVARLTEVAMEKIGNKIGERLATKAINDAVDNLEKIMDTAKELEVD